MPYQHYLSVVLTICAAMAMPAGAQETKPGPRPAAGSLRPPRDQTGEFQFAVAAADRGDVKAARMALDKLLSNNPEHAVRHSATILRGQLDGAFKTRQAFWRDREVGDHVVLVPDERAFIEAIRQWTPKRFWPVLIEDGWFTPMFVAAFAPSRVLRWSRIADPADTDISDSLSNVISAHHRRISAKSSNRPRPPGIVALDPNGPLRTGGLALALGRRQPVIATVVGNSVYRLLDSDAALSMNATLVEAAARQGVHARGEWFGLTLAAQFPYKYRVDDIHQGDANKNQASRSLRALDDLIGQWTLDGGHQTLRVAVVGRLTGGPAQGVYQAMCSLFLQPQRMLWVDTYAENHGGLWPQFHMDAAVKVIRDRFRCDLMSGSELTLERFRAATHPINRYGMIWMNTSGGSTVWTIPGKGRTDDFPIGAATVMNVIHSHSLASAWNSDTLAGRAIAGGAYWYFGAMHEPYLHAFNTPAGMVHKIKAGTPIAFAARKISLSPGMGAVPWRLMLVGDPLYVLRESAATRVPSDPIEAAPPVALSDDGLLTDRLRDAVLVDSEAALPLASQCLQQVETLEPDDLVRAVAVLYAQKRFGFLNDVSDAIAARHKMAEVMVRLSRLSRGQGVTSRKE